MEFREEDSAVAISNCTFILVSHVYVLLDLIEEASHKSLMLSIILLSFLILNS